MEITPRDSRYVPLTQQRRCCVPTCIQMVMLKHGIPLVPVEKIGYEMGLIVPKEETYLFWNARTGKRPPAGYGTQAGKPKYGPNSVFKRLGIPLKMNWRLINKFKNIEEFKKYLSSVAKRDMDVLVCFDWPSLFDTKNKDHWGHVCLLDKTNDDGISVRIIDPEYMAPKWRIVKTEDLYSSMRVHGSNNSGGFWELTKI